MSITRCISSHMMSGLLVWRNPQGKEENWLKNGRGAERIEKPLTHFGKIVVTEIGLSILTTVALVEILAYEVLGLLSLVLYPVTDRPCNFFGTLLPSCAFTVFWGIGNLFIFNPFFINVLTREDYARKFVCFFAVQLFRNAPRP